MTWALLQKSLVIIILKALYLYCKQTQTKKIFPVYLSDKQGKNLTFITLIKLRSRNLYSKISSDTVYSRLHISKAFRCPILFQKKIIWAAIKYLHSTCSESIQKALQFISTFNVSPTLTKNKLMTLSA